MMHSFYIYFIGDDPPMSRIQYAGFFDNKHTPVCEQLSKHRWVSHAREHIIENMWNSPLLDSIELSDLLGVTVVFNDVLWMRIVSKLANKRGVPIEVHGDGVYFSRFVESVR